MIPNLGIDGNLPPGIHQGTWQEFVKKFGTTRHRQKLLRGLKSALESLKVAGCKTVYIGGSFVTSKQEPSDFDGCWDIEGVDVDLLNALEPVLFDFKNSRAAQKVKFYGELFPTSMQEGKSCKPFLDFFQIDKETGHLKGIIALDLRGL